MLEMFSQKMRRRIDPMEMTILGQDGKIHPPSASRSGLILDKQIRVNKDVNGIAVTSDNILLLACGTGTLGGLCTLDLDTEQTTLHQKGRHFRQIGVDTNGTIYTSTQDTIHTYRIDNLDSPASVISPGPKVWGLCKTEDNQFIFGDIKKKKVYRNNNQGNSLVAQKTEENHIKSVWSLACSEDRLYISDRKKRQVVCTDLKNGGAYMWRQKLGRPFPKYKRAFEDMATNYFGGMCTDAAGNIFVCDTANDRLSYITRDGAMTHYDNLGLDGPAHVATNGSTVVVADCVTILDCMVKVYKPSTSL